MEKQQDRLIERTVRRQNFRLERVVDDYIAETLAQ
jgi:hypothetical protein